MKRTHPEPSPSKRTPKSAHAARPASSSPTPPLTRKLNPEIPLSVLHPRRQKLVVVRLPWTSSSSRDHRVKGTAAGGWVKRSYRVPACSWGLEPSRGRVEMPSSPSSDGGRLDLSRVEDHPPSTSYTTTASPSAAEKGWRAEDVER